jgi:hypothetical protein
MRDAYRLRSVRAYLQISMARYLQCALTKLPLRKRVASARDTHIRPRSWIDAPIDGVEIEKISATIVARDRRRMRQQQPSAEEKGRKIFSSR